MIHALAPVNRNDPKRAESSESTYSFMEFAREFPDDKTCLDWLWRERFAPDGHTADCPKCAKPRRFHRVKDRPAYDCDTCGHHLHPLAGTIFHKSSTSLQLWFFAMYIMASTRCGVSAKQLERELGVTYKTAWRMFNLIRNELMAQDDNEPLSGEVEADEMFVGGKPRNSDRRMWAENGWSSKQAAWDKKFVVFGAVERGGKVRAEVVRNSRGQTLRGKVHEFVVEGSMLFTDEYPGYDKLGTKYRHQRIRHRDRVYVEGDVHTQTIEGFWSLTKNGIRGVYHSVSSKWLQGYLNEYAWRYNRRDNGRAMFLDLLAESVSRAR
jgi:transposase